jgi:hypothetical protein
MRWRLIGTAAALLAGIGSAAFAQDGLDTPPNCDFDIAGTWEAVLARGDAPVPARYRFAGNGMVVTLSRDATANEWVEKAGAASHFYRLDDPKAPSLIEFLGADAATRRGSMEISEFDDGSFTTLDANSEPTRWVRVDPEHHFILFTALRGDVAKGGPAFATLVRAGADGRSSVESFGIYFAEGLAIVGAIPTALSGKHLVESRLETESMLRLELTRTEYDRAMAVLRSWDRRARENKMFYEVPYLNSVVFLEQLALTLNRCNERIKVKKLGWNVGDKITAANNLPQIPFFFVRELRKENDKLHLRNDEFQQRMGGSCVGNCRAQSTPAPAPLPEQVKTKLSSAPR